MKRAVAQGHYAKKQLLSSSRLIAWSHRRRFERAVELVLAQRPERLLDFGCGDGTFLALLADHPDGPTRLVGAEVSDELVEDCRRRLSGDSRLRFILTNHLDDAEHQEAYDCVTCMEVLEHVVFVERELDRLARCLAPRGVLIVSVPVETGPAVLVKQTVRRIAGWRGIGDYPGTTPYRWMELARSTFAGARPHLVRPVYEADGRQFHDHKGFNWRVVEHEIAARLEVERRLTSPVGWLPPGLSSQVWFVARKSSDA